MTAKPGRKRKYQTAEELREARNEAQRRYNQRKKEAHAHAMRFMGEESHGLPYDGVDPKDDQRRTRNRLPGGYGVWRLSEEDTKKHKERVLQQKRDYAKKYYYKLKYAAMGNDPEMLAYMNYMFNLACFMHTQAGAEEGVYGDGPHGEPRLSINTPLAVQMRSTCSALQELCLALGYALPPDVNEWQEERGRKYREENPDHPDNHESNGSAHPHYAQGALEKPFGFGEE